MSVSYCTECEQVVEGETYEQKIDGVMTNTCRWCGAEVVEKPEE